MKLLHIIASVNPEGGGPVEGILQQNGALPVHEGQREIVTLDSPDAPFLENYPIKVHPTGMGKYTDGIRSRIKRFGYTPTFTKWLDKNVGNYDAVIVNGLWNYASVGAARVLPAKGVPYFVFTHGMLDPWFREAYPFKHLQKQVSWSLFEGPLLSKANGVLFTCDDEMILAKRAFVGYNTYKAIVAGYGTGDVQGCPARQRDAFAARCPGLQGRKYLLFLSRIHPKKGCDLLLSAFADIAADYPELDLVLAGPDQTGWMPKLKAQASDLGIEKRVHWPGMLRGEEKWGAFQSAEAFILPSHQENFGIVVAEALACGKPVLITNKVNIWREVLKSEAGLVSEDTAPGICRMMRSFLGLNEEEKFSLRKNARSCYLEYFDIKSTSSKLMDIIRKNIS